MQQLTSLDSVFLSLETRKTPRHVGRLPSSAPATAASASTASSSSSASGSAPCDRFGWPIKEVPFGLDMPYRIKDKNFEIHKHVTRAALPSPGSDLELAEGAAVSSKLWCGARGIVEREENKASAALPGRALQRVRRRTLALLDDRKR